MVKNIQKRNSIFYSLSSKFCGFILLSIFYFLFSNSAMAATLYLEPAIGSHTVDSTFSIAVKINSGVAPINAAEATLTFNPEEINVVSLSKAGSIFSLWTTEPIFSNTAGTIEWAGGTPVNFTGTAGTIIIIDLKAIKSATASVNFISGAVLAADGKGTDILANMSNGVYILNPVIVVPPPQEKEDAPFPITTEAPFAPVISSLTHPDEEKWYLNNDPEFIWEIPADATAVKSLINKIPRAIPTTLHPYLISGRKLKDLEDGIWYFHVRFENQYGWGAVSDRKVLIDTKAPKAFEIKVDNKGDITNPKPFLYFETEDALSGIDFYELEINGTIITVKESFYKMPFREPGEHRVIVSAFDMAGNSTVASVDVIIKPIRAALPFLLGAGGIAIDYQGAIIALAALNFALIIFGLYAWYRISIRRKRISNKTKEIAKSVAQTFNALREEVQEQVECFDKEPGLTKEEKEIRDKLQEALSISEDFINKEIKDVEKELE